MSLGALKASQHELFCPALPADKVETIAALGFGVMDKIFLEWDSVFWDPANPGIQLIRHLLPASITLTLTVHKT